MDYSQLLLCGALASAKRNQEHVEDGLLADVVFPSTTMMPMGAMGGQQPVFVVNQNAKRETGHKAQLSSIEAGKNMAAIIRTTLGPKSMLKMILDPMSGIVLTNDGHAILREIDVTHPAAKSMLEISRAQDEEVGDGTTSVIVLSGEVLSVAAPLFEQKIHPTVIVRSFMQGMEMIDEILEDIAVPLDHADDEAVGKVVRASIDTKFVSRWGSLVSDLALKSARTVTVINERGKKEIDLKRYAKVEKIPGGSLSDCQVLNGCMVNKDVTHARMSRHIKNPRVVLLDCTLEYKKGESQTNVEITKETDFAAILEQEEKEVRKFCEDILRVKPDVVVTEKGVSDLAQHFLMKAGVSCIRRVRKTDNNRLSRVTGATIVNRCEDLQESHVGTRCGTFKVDKIGEEYFSYFVDCEEPKACTVLLRGASKDVLNEIERNLHDAFHVARNILLEPKLLPGGGATEMEVAARLAKKAKGCASYSAGQTIVGAALPLKALASSLEVIPRTLAQNCGLDVVRIMTELRAKHAQEGGQNWGIDGNAGKLDNTLERGIFDVFSVKQQTIKAAIEAAAMLLRIDDIVSGISRKQQQQGGGAQGGDDHDPETFGDNRDG